MKKLRPYLLALVLVLAVAAPAEAHTLTKKRADKRAHVEVLDFVDASDDYWGEGCPKRLSRHKRRCIIVSYDSTADVTCDAYVNVRFRNRRSYRTVAGSWYQVQCFPGDAYDMVSNVGASSAHRGSSSASRAKGSAATVRSGPTR